MRYVTSVAVDASPEQVWAVVADVERWPEWTASVTRVELLDPGPLAVGTRVRVRQPRLPTAVWRVDELVPGQAFTWSTSGPGVRTTGEHRVSGRPGGSTVTLALRQAGPVGAVLGVVLGRLTRRYVDTEAAGLRRRCEAR